METILAIIVGLLFGTVVGAAVGFAIGRVSKRPPPEGSVIAELRAERTVANKRISDAESAAAEDKRNAEEYRQKAAEGEIEIAKLNTKLNAELEVANKRISDFENSAVEYKRSAEEYRQKVTEGNVQIASLNTAFEASQERYGALEQTNAELRDATERAQRQMSADATEIADLKAQFDAAKKRLTEYEQTSADLADANRKAQSDNTRIAAENAELRAQLDAANNRIAEYVQANAELAAGELKAQSDNNRAAAENADLKAQLDAANKRVSEYVQINTELTDANAKAQSDNTHNAAENAELAAQLAAANNRLAEYAQTNADLADAGANTQSDNTRIAAENAELKAQLDAANKRLAEQTDIEKTLLNQFKVMANNALKANNDEFIKAADEKIGALVTQANKDFSLSKDAVNEMVKPLSDELKRIEEARNKSQGSLTEQIKALQENNTSLISETRNLTTALKRPEVRGSWGEMQLRRVVELAGMQDYCDYEEQVSVTADDGSRDRPDMVVRMPNNRTIVVDAKAPMDAYLTAVESDSDDQRKAAINRHSRQVRERAQSLSQKAYQQIFERSPDFVVMFLPGEYLLSAALETDRDLIDWAMQRNVIIATPNTLMALLKAVAMGWREAQIEEEAAKVAQLGQELHDRIRVFAGHMSRMGSSLDGAVKAFNSGVGSLESRVLTSARRFSEYGVAANQDIPELSEIATQQRDFRSAELRALPEPTAAGDD